MGSIPLASRMLRRSLRAFPFVHRGSILRRSRPLSFLHSLTGWSTELSMDDPRKVQEINVPCTLLGMTLHRVDAIAGEAPSTIATDLGTYVILDGSSLSFRLYPLGAFKVDHAAVDKVNFFCIGNGNQRK